VTVGRAAEVAALLIAMTFAIRALADVLAHNMDLIAALFVMAALGRLLWFYTR